MTARVKCRLFARENASVERREEEQETQEVAGGGAPLGRVDDRQAVVIVPTLRRIEA